jgi:AcrR family transcriptional regulator
MGPVVHPTIRSVVTRGNQTREHLLDVAEQLFGDYGLDNVSLRQIRIAAGQGNAAAVQYHFGDRDGVVDAIAARHRPRMLAIQSRLAATVDDGPGTRLARLVEALVRPVADYITLGPSERAWIKILADLLSDPQLSLETITEQSDDQSVDVARNIIDELTATMSADLAAERIWAVSQFAIHICANRAKVQDDPKSARELSADDAFARNLVDMATGALTAPVTSPPGGAPAGTS